MPNLDEMMSRVTDRYEPDHDYEPGDDGLCLTCGRAVTSYRHN